MYFKFSKRTLRDNPTLRWDGCPCGTPSLKPKEIYIKRRMRDARLGDKILLLWVKNLGDLKIKEKRLSLTRGKKK